MKNRNRHWLRDSIHQARWWFKTINTFISKFTEIFVLSCVILHYCVYYYYMFIIIISDHHILPIISKFLAEGLKKGNILTINTSHNYILCPPCGTRGHYSDLDLLLWQLAVLGKNIQWWMCCYRNSVWLMKILIIFHPQGVMTPLTDLKVVE